MKDLTDDKSDYANDYAIECPAKGCLASIGEVCQNPNGTSLVNEHGTAIVHFARRLKRVLMQTK